MKLCAHFSFEEVLAAPPEESDIRLDVTPTIGDLQVKKCSLNMFGVSLVSSNQFLEGRDLGHRVPTCLLMVVSGFYVGLKYLCL